MWLFDEILDSDLPEDPWVGSTLSRYFPARLRDGFGQHIPRHPLKREIVATHVLNSMVNRVGSTFVHRLADQSGARPAQVVRAFLVVREVMDDVALWQQVQALDNVVADAVQAELLIAEGELTSRATTWLLRSRRLTEPMADSIARFKPAVATLRERLAEPAAASAPAQAWIAAGVPAALAQRVVSAEGLIAALDIAEVAQVVQRDVAEVAAVHVGVAQRLGLADLRRQIDGLPADSYWQGLAKAALVDDVAGLQRAITQAVFGASEGGASERLAAWEANNRLALDRASHLLAELGDAADLAMLSVALRELRNLV
jgi:glutamate dehydrogenase